MVSFRHSFLTLGQLQVLLFIWGKDVCILEIPRAPHSPPSLFWVMLALRWWQRPSLLGLELSEGVRGLTAGVLAGGLTHLDRCDRHQQQSPQGRPSGRHAQQRGLGGRHPVAKGSRAFGLLALVGSEERSGRVLAAFIQGTVPSHHPRDTGLGLPDEGPDSCCLAWIW